MRTYNTYVGARYVPLLVGDWDTTKQTEYEPLTVVQYQGNSYTSRTYVPKNIDITNTEYWVATGNYNAQVEEYRRTTEEYKEEVVNVKTGVDSLFNNLKTLNIHQYRWLIIGDSYSMTIYSPSTNKSWADYLVDYLGLNSDEYEINRINGGGFINGLWNTAIQHSSLATDKPVICVICGGFNDGSELNAGKTYADFLTARDKVYITLNSKFTLAELKIGFIGWECYSVAMNRNNLKSLGLAMTSYKLCAELSRVSYLDGVEYALRDFSLMSEDGGLFHPNDAGQRYLSKAINNSVLNGTAQKFVYNSNVTNNTICSLTGSATLVRGTINEFCEGNNGVIAFDNVYYTITTSNNSGSGWINALTLPDKIGSLIGNESCTGSGSCVIRLNNSDVAVPYRLAGRTIMIKVPSEGVITGITIDGGINMSADVALYF